MHSIVFEPSESQMRTKALFWKKAESMPGDTHCTLAEAINLTGDRRLNDWWKLEGFVDWFAEKDSWRVDLEVLCYQLPGYCKAILDNPNPKTTTAKVQILKLLAEVGNKMPAKNKEIRYVDEIVGKMDKEALKEFIDKNVKKLKAVNND